MWKCFLILMGFSLILLVGTTFAKPGQTDIQGGEGDPLPSPTYPPNLMPPAFSLTPTATMSPRAIVGIFQSLRVNYGLEVDSTYLVDTNPVTRGLLEVFAQQYLGSSLHMPYVEHVFSGMM